MTGCWWCGRAINLAGTFGKVFECSDLKYDGSLVAVKIVRNEPLFKKAALNEIKVLKKLDGILPPAFRCYLHCACFVVRLKSSGAVVVSLLALILPQCSRICFVA